MANPQVQTTRGAIEGLREGDLDVFRGIPFAAPPVGPLRWHPPQPHDAWDGVRPCHEFGNACIQEPLPLPMKIMEVDGPQSEDCLYLNVWTPGCDDAERPVMVWIHGGGLSLGVASQALYDGARLASRDAVIVTVNYRLAALGFLHLSTLTDGRIPATGNEGFLDQVAALAWVQENIRAFGGSPDNVTIFGESAGSWSVSTLMAMPSAAGLFHRAIAQSGVGNAALPLGHGVDIGQEFLADVGLDGRDVDALLALPVEQVLAAGMSFTRSIAQMSTGAMGTRYHRAVIDGEVLPGPVLDRVAAGSAANVDLMAGTTRDELAAFLAPNADLASAQAVASGNAYNLDTAALFDDYRAARMNRLARIGDADIASAISTDAVMRIPCIRLLEAQRTHRDVFHYIVTWSTPAGDGAAGANHGIDLGFVFGTHEIDPAYATAFGGGPAARALADATMDAWVAFARTGNPSTDSLGAWATYGNARETMMIGEQTGIFEAPYEAERRAWDAVGNEVLQTPAFERRFKD